MGDASNRLNDRPLIGSVVPGSSVGTGIRQDAGDWGQAAWRIKVRTWGADLHLGEAELVEAEAAFRDDTG
ncbi:hypothetical protein GCM10018952_69760 [Streptosporangium vulgare]